ncbi:type I secretion system permease/ATPase [Sphingobium aromaticiconvertens]|uniref:type I secretion system permease/ATPase n=1 Tax=Sphingobium aromaticiconvertens TaxID=365341 RepID=UPI00301A0145
MNIGDRQSNNELANVARRYRSTYITVGMLSAGLNVLVLGGSLYMMLVYDSVLPSHSIPTLVGLFGLLLIVYTLQGLFDHLRGRLLSDVGGAFQHALARRTHMVMSGVALSGQAKEGGPLAPLQDLDSIRAFMSGPGPVALIDLPWILFFVGILSLLHPWLGVVALIGGGLLFALTLLTDRLTRKPHDDLARITLDRQARAQVAVRHAGLLSALGMEKRVWDRWDRVDRAHGASLSRLSARLQALSGISRIGRMLLQSVLLTVGAVLVINGQASGGVIFASSVLAARALAPVDQVIANWRGLIRARQSWARLSGMLAAFPETATVSVDLPMPTREVKVENVSVGPPLLGKATVRGIDFTLEAGDGLAIIGPSAAGKSTLGRAIAGVWPAMQGAVRLDGAALDQWDRGKRGSYVGYMPQGIELLDGTIAQNIARFEDDPVASNIVAAAHRAGVHDMIVAMPEGYETQVGPDGVALSMGQQQMIALARALYRDPFLLILDEPNSSIDAAGEAALQKAIAWVRHRKGIVVVIAHRPSTLINLNKVLVLNKGEMQTFGLRDQVVQDVAGRGATTMQPTASPASRHADTVEQKGLRANG